MAQMINASPTSTARATEDLVLLTPELGDADQSEVTILTPAVNEELAVGYFVDWCKQGLADAGVVGDILIVDSSTDATSEIALSNGARVLKTPKRGAGQGLSTRCLTSAAST